MDHGHRACAALMRDHSNLRAYSASTVTMPWLWNVPMPLSSFIEAPAKQVQLGIFCYDNSMIITHD